MEGICDMFKTEESTQEWKFSKSEVEIGQGETIQVYEVKGQEDGIIGQAVWNGAKIMANWI